MRHVQSVVRRVLLLAVLCLPLLSLASGTPDWFHVLPVYAAWLLILWLLMKSASALSAVVKGATDCAQTLRNLRIKGDAQEQTRLLALDVESVERLIRGAILLERSLVACTLVLLLPLLLLGGAGLLSLIPYGLYFAISTIGNVGWIGFMAGVIVVAGAVAWVWGWAFYEPEVE